MGNWQLHARQAGDPARPTICFLHGFLGSHREWQPWVDAWSDHYHTVALDLPGHGDTPTCDDPNAYTVPGAARAVTDWLTTHHCTPAYIVGYSLGGRIALTLACQQPLICRRAVIESSSPGLLDARLATARRRHDECWAQRFENEPLDQVLDAWYRQPIFASLHSEPDRYARMKVERQKNRPTEMARVLRGMSVGVQDSLWSDLPRVTCDLLVLAGEADAKYTEIAARMAALSPRIQDAVIPGAGHNTHWEAPDAWAQRVHTFSHIHSQTKSHS